MVEKKMNFSYVLAQLYKILKRPIVIGVKYLGPLFAQKNKGVLVFQSTPDYSDNSRAFSEYLEQNGYLAKYDLYWCVNDVKKFKNLYPNSKIKFIRRENRYGDYPLNVFLIFAKANFFFGTHGFPVPSFFCKSKQKKILLWHGCSFKRSSPNAQKNYFDKALVAGPIFLKTKAEYWMTPEKKLIAKGYPRYDWLLKCNPIAEKLVHQLKESCNKIVLWMPTFRNDKNGKYNESGSISEFPLIKDSVDWINVDNVCKKYNILLLVKLHMFQKDYDVDFSNFSNIKLIDNNFFEKNNIQMYEFIALTDALLTDYSSVGVDYLVVDKPIGFTLDDFGQYCKTRGFVFDDPREYMPGHHIYTVEQLKDFLCDVANEKDLFKNMRHKMKNVAIFESNCYSKAIADAIGLVK